MCGLKTFVVLNIHLLKFISVEEACVAKQLTP